MLSDPKEILRTGSIMSVLVRSRGEIFLQCRWLNRKEVLRNNGPFDTVRTLVSGNT